MNLKTSLSPSFLTLFLLFSISVVQALISFTGFAILVFVVSGSISEIEFIPPIFITLPYLIGFFIFRLIFSAIIELLKRKLLINMSVSILKKLWDYCDEKPENWWWSREQEQWWKFENKKILNTQEANEIISRLKNLMKRRIENKSMEHIEGTSWCNPGKWDEINIGLQLDKEFSFLLYIEPKKIIEQKNCLFRIREPTFLTFFNISFFHNFFCFEV